jgi:transcriptional regulator CtsR
MLMTDMIAQMIEQLLAESETAVLDLQRNELASRLGCAPSQINYVISSRFTQEKGYIIESKRGGGGYIRIRRVSVAPSEALQMAFASVGSHIDLRSATVLLRNLLGASCLTEREAALMASAISDRTLKSLDSRFRDFVRADILRSMLLSLIGSM